MSVVNNYKVANLLDDFMRVNYNPIKDKLAKAYRTVDEEGSKWPPEMIEKAKLKIQSIEAVVISYDEFFGAIKELVKQHEDLTELVASCYYIWNANIAFKGKQQKEMMQSQADMLQGIFDKLHKAIEPLNLLNK